jgi:hypothetical protein
MNVSIKEIEIIGSVLDKNITDDGLRNDLLDHLCCVVETKMDAGKEFGVALSEAILELAPDGLNEIQLETTLLLNPNPINSMKKIMFAVGLFSSIAMCVGWTANVLHLPGSSDLASWGIGTVGFLAFAFLFLPMRTLNYFKSEPGMALSDKARIVSGCLSGLLTGFAVLFKIQHLQGGYWLLLAGTAVFSFGFLPLLFLRMYRRSVA